MMGSFNWLNALALLLRRERGGSLFPPISLRVAEEGREEEFLFFNVPAGEARPDISSSILSAQQPNTCQQPHYIDL